MPPRLGDLLVQAGRVTAAQVEDAARAQVAYGGRIGTNLVELDYLEIDELAVFLGRQHRLAAAQHRHFDAADPALQALLPAAVASRLGVVPIARLAGDSTKIAIAAQGPLTPDALAEIAAALGCVPGDFVVGVAAELRILYNLERVYGVARPKRFLRTRRGGTQDASIAPLDPADSSDDELAIPDSVEAAVSQPIAEAEAEELELAPDTGPAEPAPGYERRRFVRTLADDVEPPNATEPLVPASLGRIQLRKLAFAAAIEGSAASGESVTDGLRAIRRCRDRDRIGALVIDCLDRGTGEDLDAGVLFVARGQVAVGWHGFARGAEVDFDQLALPLDVPSVIAREPGACVRRVAPGSAEMSPLDERLIAALGFEPPTFVIAAPIAIRDHIIGFVYGQGRGAPVAAEALVVEVADAARAALTSLLRAAQR